MTPDEIISEIARDREWKRKILDEYGRSRLVDKVKKKYKKHLCVYFYRKRKTPRGNIVLFLFWLTRKNLKETWKGYGSAVYLTENGNEQYILADCYNWVLRFTWHFFKGYKERMIQEGDPDIKALLANTKDLLQVVTIFYMHNIKQVASFSQNKKTRHGMSEALCVTEDGVLFGTESNDKKLLQLNTFLTKEMLTNVQHSMYNKTKDEQSDLYNILDNIFGGTDWQTDKNKINKLRQIEELIQNHWDELI